MEKPRYKVILSGNVMPERHRDEVLKELTDLFGSTPDVMEKVLQGHQTLLKKEYDKSHADAVCQKIRKAGAQCRIEEISEGNIAEEDITEEGIVKNEPKGAWGNTEEVVGTEKVQSLLMQFVGTNTDYYRQQFTNFGSPENPSFKLTWHWPAFFFFFFWALYRKMWGLAGFYMAFGMGVTTMIGNPDLAFSLVWLILWPCVANYLYYRKASAGVCQVVENPEMESDYLRRGGVSRGAVWGGVGAMMVLSMWAGNHVTSQFLREHGEELKAVMPGSGTQLTRDGSAIETIVGSKSELAKSSLTLSYLATSLKLLLAAENSAQDNAVTDFIATLNGGEYNDGWGNGIRVMEEVDRYVLFSAGPDQTYNTGDDILQAVNLR